MEYIGDFNRENPLCLHRPRRVYVASTRVEAALSSVALSRYEAQPAEQLEGRGVDVKAGLFTGLADGAGVVGIEGCTFVVGVLIGPTGRPVTGLHLPARQVRLPSLPRWAQLVNQDDALKVLGHDSAVAALGIKAHFFLLQSIMHYALRQVTIFRDGVA